MNKQLFFSSTLILAFTSVAYSSEPTISERIDTMQEQFIALQYDNEVTPKISCEESFESPDQELNNIDDVNSLYNKFNNLKLDMRARVQKSNNPAYYREAIRNFNVIRKYIKNNNVEISKESEFKYTLLFKQSNEVPFNFCVVTYSEAQ